MAERRLVSVLFADLVGFTTLSEHRDSEEVREFLSRYFDVARDIIQRYGGTVEKFIGDAVMAVWGAPVAHEDDAERAVRAGLELVEAVTAMGREIRVDDLHLRAGVLTGEAAISLAAEGQGMVAGDLVNTASRLQSAAAPGTVLVGEATYLAANKAIAFEDAGSHTLKGKELSVRAWRAAHIVAGHAGFKRSETLEPPFVGRDEDLRALKDSLHTVARERRPRLISVLGIGGIGKSRLGWEFFKYVDGLVETIYWHEGRCPPYGEGVTFWALGEMVRMRARITEGEDRDSSLTKLSAVLGDFVPEAAERRWIEPRLGYLLGLEQAAPGDRQELFAAWRTFFERISDRGPVVMVFEDLQWADSGLIDFIEHTLQWARSHPILIVTLARPELMDKRPTWGAGQRSFTSQQLEALPEEAMRKLLSGLAEGLPDHVVDEVVTRSEGIPLYAVEMVRMLVDQGHLIARNGRYELQSSPDHLEVPSSLQSLITSRLDDLDAAERALLQDASVLGKTFSLDALCAVSGAHREELERRLQPLVQRELLTVETDPWSPERGQYGFVQSLIREVAYGMLSRRDRVAKHQQAADYFELLEDDELSSVVAGHYLQAYRLSGDDASGPLGEKARRWLEIAAERAASLGSPAQAVAQIERALEISTEDVERARLLESAAAYAVDAAGLDHAQQLAREAIELHNRRGDTLSVASATAVLARGLRGLGMIDQAIEEIETVLPQLEGLGTHEEVTRLVAELAGSYMVRGDFASALEKADKGLVVAEQLNDASLISMLLTTKGVALTDSGRDKEGVILLRGSLALAQRQGIYRQQARALTNLAYALILDSPKAALEVARDALGLARRIGDRHVELVATDIAQNSATSTGEWEEAIHAAELIRSDLPDQAVAVQLVGSGLKLQALKGEDVDDLLENVLQRVSRFNDPQIECAVREAEAVVALTLGDLERARTSGFRAAKADPTGEHAAGGEVVAARAALWAQDESGVSEALAAVEGRLPHGEWLHAQREIVSAGLQALRGETEGAARNYVEAIKMLEALQVWFDVALAQLDFATVLGDKVEAARHAAKSSRLTFERLGARPLLSRLDHVEAQWTARSLEGPVVSIGEGAIPTTA